MGKTVYITRRITFSACHRLHSHNLSKERNVEIYGKCNHINGHGHNYVVKVTVCGLVDEITGMVINLTDLKLIMKEVIDNRMDHKCLDKDIDYFKTKPSTAENIAIYIWDEISSRLENCRLYKVKVIETENNTAVYKGEMS